MDSSVSHHSEQPAQRTSAITLSPARWLRKASKAASTSANGRRSHRSAGSSGGANRRAASTRSSTANSRGWCAMAASENLSSSRPSGARKRTGTPLIGRTNMNENSPCLHFGGFIERQVVFPAFVFELDVFDGDGVAAGIQIDQALELAYPAAMDDVAVHRLPGFIQQLDANLAAQVLERTRRRAPIEHLRGIGPFLE